MPRHLAYMEHEVLQTNVSEGVIWYACTNKLSRNSY